MSSRVGQTRNHFVLAFTLNTPGKKRGTLLGGFGIRKAAESWPLLRAERGTPARPVQDGARQPAEFHRQLVVLLLPEYFPVGLLLTRGVQNSIRILRISRRK